ncbi:MAG: hypothetical protein H5U10_08265 [Desulfacinum sp.]|nr:hypothetical protein [Desulfacinum sp.]
MSGPSHFFSESELRQWIATAVAEAFREKLDELFAEKVAAFVAENERRSRELSLMERVVRVEQELKALREIEAARFEAMDRRFEALDKRLSFLQWMIGIGFSAIALLVGLMRFKP